MKTLRPLLAAVALTVLTLPSLRATSVVAPEFDQLAQTSDLIIRGRVVALKNEVQLREGREVPFTKVEVEVKQVIAGEADGRVVLTMLGGQTSDGSTLKVEGVPQFTVGDESILFVQGNGENFYPLNAVMHGFYAVKYDKQLAREYVTRANGVPLTSTAEVALPLAESTLAQQLRRTVKISDALTPSEFVQSIRAARAATKTSGGELAK